VINADDFYGKDAYQILAAFLRDPDSEKKCCVVGYVLSEVLSEHGTVSRGICELDTSGHLARVVENKKIYTMDGKIVSEWADGEIQQLAPDALCSMNMMGFTSGIMPFYKQYFHDFLKESIEDLKSEFYMPNVISRRMQEE
jgi:hypothetical protein